MMKFKKFLAAAIMGTMVFSSVAMAVPAVSVYAEDKKTDDKLKIEINYKTMEAAIDSERGDMYIKLEVLKEKNGNVEVENPSAFYTYPLNGGYFADDVDCENEHDLIVDLSFLKLSKDAVIQVRGNVDGFATPSAYVTVNKQEKKESIKFEPTYEEKDGKTTLLLGDSFKLKTGTLKGKENAYEFKTLYGSDWQSLSDFDVDAAVMAGTTLIVRTAAVSETKASKDTSTTPAPGAPAGAEAKVKVAAAPKAPKVKVDYKKGTITLPKDSLVTVLYTTGGGTEEVTVDPYMEVTETKMYKKVTGENDSVSYEEITNEDLEAYFTVDDEGTVTVQDGADTLYSDDSGTAIDFTDTTNHPITKYVTGHEASTKTEPVEVGTIETSTQPISANTSVTPAEILDFWKEGAGKVDKDELLASGFSISVQNKAGKKKAASNKAFVGIAKEEKPEAPQGSATEVTFGKDGSSKFSWTYDAVKKTYTFKATTSSFDYIISETEPDASAKWITVAAGKESKKNASDVEGKKIFVRVSGDAKATPAKLPSGACSFTMTAAKATVTIGTETELENVASKLVADANATAKLEIPLTITVKDAAGTAVTDATKYTVTVMKDGTTTAATGVNWASNKLIFNAVNAETEKGPELAKDDKYIVTVTYGTGNDAVTVKKELVVGGTTAETPLPDTVEISMTNEEKAKFKVGANTAAALELVLTVTVKDANDKEISNPTVTLEVKKDDAVVKGFSYANGKLIVAKAGDTDAPTLTEDEVYSVVVKCGGKSSAALSLTVGAQ